VEFRLLGPFEARDGERTVSLGRAKDRAFLADVLLRANQIVSFDRLVTDLWGEEPPPTAAKMVQILASRLRATLDEGPWNGIALITHPRGYELRTDVDRIDVHRFETLVRNGDEVAGIDPARAAECYRAGLDLWRGPALEGLADAPFAVPAAARLEELRSRAFDQWSDAQLRCGRHAQIVADLVERTGQQPYREDLYARLIVALYRSGRQVEALERYGEIDRRLRDELGLEPSQELRSLQIAILNQDPALDLPAAPAPGSDTPATHTSRPALETESPAIQPANSFQPASFVRRHRSALAVVSIAAVAVALAIPVMSQSATQPPTAPAVAVTQNSVAMLDATTDSVRVDVSVGTDPGFVAVDPSYAWVGNTGDHTLSQVDRSAHRVVKTFGIGSAPTSVTADGQLVWVGNGFSGTLTRVVVVLSQPSGQLYPYEKMSGLLAIAVSPGDLWVGLPNGTLGRIDPQSVQAKTVVNLFARAQQIVVLSGRLWYIGFGAPWLRAKDTTDLADAQTVDLPGNATAIAASDDRIVVATSSPNRLLEIDPSSGAIGQTFELSSRPMAIDAGAGDVWVVDEDHGLQRVDLATSTAHTYSLGRPVAGVAASGTEAWVTVR
jgi:DNA-binding SARP family transcriptional activator